MALESPLLSAGSHIAAMSPYTDFSMSPNSPAVPRSPHYQTLSSRFPSDSSRLNPNTMEGVLSPGGHLSSPSDMVGPSPVTSTGTGTTEFEDEASDEKIEEQSVSSRTSRFSVQSISTNLGDEFRSSGGDESVSVIHAPQGYGSFEILESSVLITGPRSPERSTPIPYESIHDFMSLEKSTTTEKPSAIQVDLAIPLDKAAQPSPISPPPISTDISPVKYAAEHATPRAQTRQEIEQLSGDDSSPSKGSAGTLRGIPEDQSETEDDFDSRAVQNSEQEVAALNAALHECWTLCNTLASLSSIHRERIFSYSGTGDSHERAWKCCWKLCQKLYDNRESTRDGHVKPTLEMCRDFCQALFDIRQKPNEVADSVLRVSFELNNHLFNTHDRHLPEAFRERTLDFYITLCHRLMKQRNELAEETDALLRACWGLAEMLFSLRQSKLESKAADEELLGSAVQACWDLCDLFRDGWTQVRPDRGTPRPSQTTFSYSPESLSKSSQTTHTHSKSLTTLSETVEEAPPKPLFPETPTTEFEDTPISPEESSPNIPNILVLGTENNRAGNARWSGTTSSMSNYSQGSSKSNMTVTSTEDINLTRLKILILKAAMNVGFDRTSSSFKSSGSKAPALPAFVNSLQTGSFGSLPVHTNLLKEYQNLVLSDPTFRSNRSLPAPGKKVSAIDVAKSVSWMMRSGQYTFLKDLFRFVLGFHVEEAEKRQNVTITV